MKNFLCILGASAVLAACASAPQMSAAEADARAACRRTDAPTGSNLVRKDECAPTRQSAGPAPTDVKKN